MYTFTAYGHKNISCSHTNTLEITKDKEVTPKGHCIIACNANFDLEKIKSFLKNKQLKLTIKTQTKEETIKFQPNPNFNDDKEIVIRRSDVLTDRTLGINANKTSVTLSNELKKELKKEEIITITIE